MSDGYDPIPAGAGGRVNLVEALSVAQHMPAEALERALASPGRIRDSVLAVLARAGGGETLPLRDANLLFWGVHVLGAARDPLLFGPLLRLLRRPGETALELLGDVVGTTLCGLVIGSFDGDREALFAAAADAGADETIRWTLLGAVARLVQDGRIERAAAHAFLVRFDEERLARAGDMAWAGWAETIGLLGFRDLLPRVAAAREGARLLDDEEEPGAIEELVAEAEAAPDDLARFTERGLGPIEDLLADLDEALASEDDEDAAAPEPVQNPFRHVGRNDPCPCGSGRKYKKCCLAAEP